MSRFTRSATPGRLAVVGAMALCWMAGTGPGVAYGGRGPGAADGELWGTAVVEPGREGILEVAGYAGAPLGSGSVLTLTPPKGTAVTGTPLEAGGYRGSVGREGAHGTYTFTAAASDTSPAAQASWKDRTFPFVLSVPPDATPGTRLAGCTLHLRDTRGAVRETGTCAVTVGLPAPTLTGPESGVPLNARPAAAGTAHPGAQITVHDEEEKEICTTTTASDGTWTCVPSADLPAGPSRMQATATFHGVSAHSEQIDITVAAPGVRAALALPRLTVR